MTEPTADELHAMGYTSTLRGHDAYVDMRKQWRSDMRARGYTVTRSFPVDTGTGAVPVFVEVHSLALADVDLGDFDSNGDAWAAAREHHASQSQPK